MEEKDSVSLWKQSKLLLIYSSLLSMCAMSRCQVCQLPQNMCRMWLVYGYRSNTWHTAGDCYSWKFKYLWLSTKAWTEQLAFISIILKTIPAKDPRNHLSQLCPFYWWGHWVRSWASLRSSDSSNGRWLLQLYYWAFPVFAY